MQVTPPSGGHSQNHSAAGHARRRSKCTAEVNLAAADGPSCKAAALSDFCVQASRRDRHHPTYQTGRLADFSGGPAERRAEAFLLIKFQCIRRKSRKSAMKELRSRRRYYRSQACNQSGNWDASTPTISDGPSPRSATDDLDGNDAPPRAIRQLGPGPHHWGREWWLLVWHKAVSWSSRNKKSRSQSIAVPP
jgi:hypothetical protein